MNELLGEVVVAKDAHASRVQLEVDLPDFDSLAQGLCDVGCYLVVPFALEDVAVTEAADPARSHLAWAHEELQRRPITPVTRRELHQFGLMLRGKPPTKFFHRSPTGNSLTSLDRPAVLHHAVNGMPHVAQRHTRHCS
ncbi:MULTISPECIES: hypothetical protein [unclassified Nonomuraea]|uniref:hypothetical protein n=1 Tax=unclassified Nonomuraea TaxID=2593643 RepID=UPI0033E3FF1C